MKEIIYNDLNLIDIDMDEVVTRIKVLIINSKNEILLGHTEYTYQFIGGHLEENESLVDCLNREVLEETGIELNIESLEPFFRIKHYSENYHKSNKNRISEIYYFVVKTDLEPNEEKMELTEDEKKGNYKSEYISLDKVEQILIDSIPNRDINKIIVKEMLEAIKVYKDIENS